MRALAGAVFHKSIPISNPPSPLAKFANYFGKSLFSLLFRFTSINIDVRLLISCLEKFFFFPFAIFPRIDAFLFIIHFYEILAISAYGNAFSSITVGHSSCVIYEIFQIGNFSMNFLTAGIVPNPMARASGLSV